MSEEHTNGTTGETPPARQEPNHLRRALIIWGVLSVIGIVLVITLMPFFLPVSASALDSSDDFTFIVFSVLSMPVGLFVFVFLGYCLFTFKTKGRPTEEGIPLQPRPSLQIGWLGITSVLCLFLVIWGLFAYYQETSAAAPNTLQVNVTAQQWLFTFDIPQYSVSVQSQILELPVNRPVVFNVTSEDVLHGFNIQEFGVRVDANPGEVTSTPVVIPNKIGVYTVRCVELCGLYHSFMWESVRVVSTADFNSWIISQGGHL